jgi:hypothetical protein
MQHAWKRREMHIGFFVEMPGGNRPLERPRCRWEDIKWILERYDGVIWTGLIWLS